MGHSLIPCVCEERKCSAGCMWTLTVEVVLRLGTSPLSLNLKWGFSNVAFYFLFTSSSSVNASSGVFAPEGQSPCRLAVKADGKNGLLHLPQDTALPRSSVTEFWIPCLVDQVQLFPSQALLALDSKKSLFSHLHSAACSPPGYLHANAPRRPEGAAMSPPAQLLPPLSTAHSFNSAVLLSLLPAIL